MMLRFQYFIIISAIDNIILKILQWKHWYFLFACVNKVLKASKTILITSEAVTCSRIWKIENKQLNVPFAAGPFQMQITFWKHIWHSIKVRFFNLIYFVVYLLKDYTLPIAINNSKYAAFKLQLIPLYTFKMTILGEIDIYSFFYFILRRIYITSRMISTDFFLFS